MSKKVGIIGIGNCGCQVASLAETSYPETFNSIYINTSDADLSMAKCKEESLKLKIGQFAEGSGKNRTKTKEHIKEEISELIGNKELSKIMSDAEDVFIVVSAAGGTGSGAGPVIMEIFSHYFVDINFTLVFVLPQLSASLMEQGNAVEFLHELYEVLPSETTYMCYDNEVFCHLSPIDMLETVNTSIVEDIRVISGVDNYSTRYESIDDADMESISTTPGRLMVGRVTTGITEKGIEEETFGAMMVRALKKSAHAETDRNGKVVRWGAITYFDLNTNRNYNYTLPELEEYIGVPLEKFNHNAINETGNSKMNFMHVVLSGVGPINDRAGKIRERIKELKEALAAEDAGRYAFAGEESSYNMMEIRKQEKREKQLEEKFNPVDLMSKFM